MSHELKLARAKKHMDAYKESVKGFLQSNPYKPIPELDPQTGKHLVYLDVREEPPDEWGLMIGDSVHNMRSALDALAHTISVKALPSITDGQLHKVQFPICDNFGFFNGEWCKRLPHLDATIRAVIERFQPYSTPKFPLFHPLELLRDLDNVDKHRHVVPTVMALHSGNIFLNHELIPGGLSVAFRPCIVKHRAVIGEFVLPPDVDPAEVDVASGLGFDITFPKDGPGKGAQVWAVLDLAYHHIRATVFRDLAPFLR